MLLQEPVEASSFMAEVLRSQEKRNRKKHEARSGMQQIFVAPRSPWTEGGESVKTDARKRQI